MKTFFHKEHYIILWIIIGIERSSSWAIRNTIHLFDQHRSLCLSYVIICKITKHWEVNYEAPECSDFLYIDWHCGHLSYLGFLLFLSFIEPILGPKRCISENILNIL